MTEPMLTASEIGEYAYCRRSWWLHKVKGIDPRNAKELDEGTKAHVSHGRKVRWYTYAQQIALALLFLAVLLFLIWVLGVLR